MPLKPIDDLIEGLKGKEPYGKTQTLKLWEALKILSDGLFKKGAISQQQVSGIVGSNPAKITLNETLGGLIANQLTAYTTLWSTDIVFSATDSDTVAWTTGTIKFFDGTFATIAAGNIGNMGALTYIIYHPDYSNTTFQVSIDYNDTVGDRDRILVCVANPTATANQRAFYVPAIGVFGINETQIGPNSISTGKIQANAITANEINANAVTAAKINVASLSAISVTAFDVTALTISANQITTGTLAASVAITLTDSDTVPAKFKFGTIAEMYKVVTSDVVIWQPVTTNTGWLELGAFGIKVWNQISLGGTTIEIKNAGSSTNHRAILLQSNGLKFACTESIGVSQYGWEFTNSAFTGIADNTRDLGTSAVRFKAGWFGAKIEAQELQLTATGAPATQGLSFSNTSNDSFKGYVSGAYHAIQGFIGGSAVFGFDATSHATNTNLYLYWNGAVHQVAYDGTQLYLL